MSRNALYLTSHLIPTELCIENIGQQVSLRIFPGKTHLQINIKRLRRVKIWTLG